MGRRVETPVTTRVAILQALRWGRGSGLQLMAAIEERTQGRVRVHVSLTYRALWALEAARLIRKTPERTPGGAQVWELTAKGRKLAEREAQMLGRLFSA
jgi:DNA-binding PadR family transcriptional regulator